MPSCARLSCGEVEAATLKLVLEAERGALSIFEANSHFHSSSCPQTASSWWLESRSQLGFWTLAPWTQGKPGNPQGIDQQKINVSLRVLNVEQLLFIYWWVKFGYFGTVIFCYEWCM